MDALLRHNRAILTGVVVLAVAYYVVLPWFWPDPRVEAAMPPALSLGEDLSFRLTTSAWHGNFHVYYVRFWVDNQASTAIAPGKSLFAIQVVNEPPREFKWERWLARWTRPCTHHITVSAPLHVAAEQGTLQPGVLEGKIDVRLTVAPNDTRLPAKRLQQDVPFQITVE